MKVIELLNKIANGENIPNKILIEDNLYRYQGDDYLCEDTNEWLFSNGYKKDFLQDNLNKDIEMPTDFEEDKKIEKLNYPHIEIESGADDEIRDYLFKLKDKLDEIIDYINKENKE